MTQHDTEYQDMLARTVVRDREAIIAHWELGELFARYGESVTDIARAIDRSVTYVADHLFIYRHIPFRGALDNILENRDDITSWTILLNWAKEGGPGQETEDQPSAADISRARRQRQAGGIQLTVPAHIIKGLADLGANPRDAMDEFWRNIPPNLILNVAYPDRVKAS